MVLQSGLVVGGACESTVATDVMWFDLIDYSYYCRSGSEIVASSEAACSVSRAQTWMIVGSCFSGCLS